MAGAVSAGAGDEDLAVIRAQAHGRPSVGEACGRITHGPPSVGLPRINARGTRIRRVPLASLRDDSGQITSWSGGLSVRCCGRPVGSFTNSVIALKPRLW